MVLDVSGDWAVFDWLQDTTYQTRIDEGSWADPVDCQMLKREDKKDTETGNGQIELAMHTSDWELWLNSMATPLVPKRGDKFTATGVSGSQVWLVETVDYCDRTTRYRLHCEQSQMGS